LPDSHGYASGGVDPGLLLRASSHAYDLSIRWRTHVDGGPQVEERVRFARWLLVPADPVG
jgi:hypothetical protein